MCSPRLISSTCSPLNMASRPSVATFAQCQIIHHGTQFFLLPFLFLNKVPAGQIILHGNVAADRWVDGYQELQSREERINFIPLLRQSDGALHYCFMVNILGVRAVIPMTWHFKSAVAAKMDNFFLFLLLCNNCSVISGIC